MRSNILKKAVSYLRVSGKNQIQGGGFSRQKESIRRFASSNGYEIVTSYQESHTGTEADRPVFAQMLEELLGNSVRVIIVESMDRLARDLAVQHQILALLIRKDLTLISATTGQDITASMSSDPMLRALVQIQGVFAELEKNLLVQKLSRARAQKRRDEGRCEGRKPFGFREGESEVLEHIRQLVRKPKGKPRLGPYQIARILNEEGHPSRTGKPWTGPTVKRILDRGFATQRKGRA